MGETVVEGYVMVHCVATTMPASPWMQPSSPPPSWQVDEQVAALQSASSRPIDVTIDCVGSEQSLSAALRATSAGGRVVLVGLRGGDMKLPVMANVCAREVDLVGSFRACHTFEVALQLLADRRVDIKWLVTHRLGFTQREVEEGMRISAAEASAIKVMFAL